MPTPEASLAKAERLEREAAQARQRAADLAAAQELRHKKEQAEEQFRDDEHRFNDKVNRLVKISFPREGKRPDLANYDKDRVGQIEQVIDEILALWEPPQPAPAAQPDPVPTPAPDPAAVLQPDPDPAAVPQPDPQVVPDPDPNGQPTAAIPQAQPAAPQSGSGAVRRPPAAGHGFRRLLDKAGSAFTGQS